MLDNQGYLFNLPKDITYLNCAYMSPMLKSVAEIGNKAITLKENPAQIQSFHFFDLPLKLRQQFSQLIGVKNPDDCAIVPSASYALENVARNVGAGKGDNIIILEEQFPSNVYPWYSLEKEGVTIKVVTAPTDQKERSANWNLNILAAIDSNTKLVAMPHVHWTDGTLFDLKAIRAATKAVGALLIIDGSQSIGALPFSISDYDPDMVIAVGYKWMLGPYSTGVAYYGKYFHDKTPIENSWIHRLDSEDFAGLVNYQDQYQPRARRFEVGESSNFILTPMLTVAIRQINDWGVNNIQAYCKNLTEAPVKELREMGFNIENDEYRSHHLFGIRLPQNLDPNALKEEFTKMNVFVSVRGSSVRIASHLYNDQNDMDKLIEGFKKFSNV